MKTKTPPQIPNPARPTKLNHNHKALSAGRVPQVRTSVPGLKTMREALPLFLLNNPTALSKTS
jgi:hypothetical protein